MTNAKPRFSFGILCISIFPILVKLRLTPGLISAFYRMAISLSLLLPYVLITKKLKLPNKQILILACFAGVVICFDVAVWNIAISKVLLKLPCLSI
jgi:drug/metabolite transporter (DMT)-like permease